MADSTRSAEDMVPTTTSTNDRDENSPRSSAIKKLSLRGEGRPLSLAAASAPNWGVGDGGRSADATPSGVEMAPTNKGSELGEKTFPRGNAV